MSPRPPYSQLPFLPPLTTPCSIWVTFASKVMPFSARSLRTPPQSPVRVERVKRSPKYGFTSSWAPARDSKETSRAIVATRIADRRLIVHHLSMSLEVGFSLLASPDWTSYCPFQNSGFHTASPPRACGQRHFYGPLPLVAAGFQVRHAASELAPSHDFPAGCAGLAIFCVQEVLQQAVEATQPTARRSPGHTSPPRGSCFRSAGSARLSSAAAPC